MASDTFVLLPPVTHADYVIFGKNSDRPENEVQEVIYTGNVVSPPKSKVQCTYIEVEQVPRTLATMLSKPAWMWGAEMGANEKGVVIGNESIWTKLCSTDDPTERLTGMDLVRLGLERGKTAKDALDVITNHLEKYGQGGSCFDDPKMSNLVYHNSFMIVDKTEAWVLETAGQWWAAEKIEKGTRSISNILTIETNIDLMTYGLKDFAKEKGLWNGEGDFNFAQTFQAPLPDLGTDIPEKCLPQNRLKNGQSLLETYKQKGTIMYPDMFKLLSDEDSGINMKRPCITTSSHVSVITPAGAAVHMMTGTPDPKASVFKPFIFMKEAVFGKATISPTFGDKDPAKRKPRFQKEVDRKHPLYSARVKAEQTTKGKKLSASEKEQIRSNLEELQEQVVENMTLYLKNPKSIDEDDLKCIYKDISEAEILIFKATSIVDVTDLANLNFDDL